jgi:hypothetical protein
MGLRIGSKRRRARALRSAERRTQGSAEVEHCGHRLRTIGRSSMGLDVSSISHNHGRRLAIIGLVLFGKVRSSRWTPLETGPRLVGTDKMHSIDLVPVSSVCRGVGISGGRSNIVSTISGATPDSVATHVNDNLFHSPPPPSSENHSFNNP